MDIFVGQEILQKDLSPAELVLLLNYSAGHQSSPQQLISLPDNEMQG